MREILFKAKRKNWRELPKEQWWVEGYPVFIRGTGQCFMLSGQLSLKGCLETRKLDFAKCEIDTETICQYTGLTDKNGKKIWENDILSAHWDECYPDDVTYSKVIWSGSAFKTIEKESVDETPLLKVDCDEYYIVAGNIFDNPELLEEG